MAVNRSADGQDTARLKKLLYAAEVVNWLGLAGQAVPNAIEASQDYLEAKYWSGDFSERYIRGRAKKEEAIKKALLFPGASSVEYDVVTRFARRASKEVHGVRVVDSPVFTARYNVPASSLVIGRGSKARLYDVPTRIARTALGIGDVVPLGPARGFWRTAERLKRPRLRMWAKAFNVALFTSGTGQLIRHSLASLRGWKIIQRAARRAPKAQVPVWRRAKVALLKEAGKKIGMSAAHAGAELVILVGGTKLLLDSFRKRLKGGKE